MDVNGCRECTGRAGNLSSRIASVLDIPLP